MIEINNLTPNKIDRKALINIAEKVLKGENPSTNSGRRKGDLSIVLVCGARMRSINKRYRKKDKITDVLSFSFLEDKNNKLDKELGEIIICPEVVKKNAKKFDLDYNKELARVLIHGVLHILGCDHEKSKKEAKIMEQKTEYYLSNI